MTKKKSNWSIFISKKTKIKKRFYIYKQKKQKKKVYKQKITKHENDKKKGGDLKIHKSVSKGLGGVELKIFYLLFLQLWYNKTAKHLSVFI